MPSASALDAVTLDAMGTLVDLENPVPGLQAALTERGVERDAETVAAAFQAEVAYYVARTTEGYDEASLVDLRRRCAAVFLEHAGAVLDAGEFAPAFVGTIAFRPLPGVEAALARLGRAGLPLAVVSNWDVSLADHLERAGLACRFAAVVSSAEAGAAKPDRRPFQLALERLAVSPARALHCGDGDSDREGAAAAGLLFEPTPLATLPERLGLGRRP